MTETILNVNGVTQQFGGLVAVNNVTCNLQKGEVVAIIGPNGAGKTTLFNAITGILSPTSGSITYRGHDITNRKSYEITKLGLARTFQNIRLFQDMTVLENVLVGLHTRNRISIFSSLLKLPGYWKYEKKVESKALELLELTGLADYRYHYSTSLPYGLQRRLEIARAIATSPEILLLDEPAAGMNEHETSELMQFIREMNQMGYTFMIIEHDMRFVMSVCKRIYVLDHGALIAQGTPAEIKANPTVIEAYLGKEAI